MNFGIVYPPKANMASPEYFRLNGHMWSTYAMKGRSLSRDSQMGADGISSRLVGLQQLHGWSATEMARRSSIPRRSMENYLKGQKPGVDALLAMARGLKVPVEWLLDGESEGPEAQSAIVAEAAWQVVRKMFQAIIHHEENGRGVFQDGKIYAKGVDQYSVKIANEISQEYLRLLSSDD